MANSPHGGPRAERDAGRADAALAPVSTAVEVLEAGPQVAATWLRWDAAPAREGFNGVRWFELRPAAEDADLRELEVRLMDPLEAPVFELDAGVDRVPIPFTIVEVDDVPPRVVLRFRPDLQRTEHRLTLVGGQGADIHPFFARVAFFPGAARRPTAATARVRAPRPAPPAVDLRTRDFPGFLALLADRAQVINPQWTRPAPGALESVLMDLLAHQGDMLAWYQDRVVAEGFVGSATQRHSLRQHAALLGHRLFDGEAASTALAVVVERDGELPAGTAVGLGQRQDVVFHLPEPARVRAALNELTLAHWPGSDGAVLSAGARQALLAGRPPVQAGQRLALVAGTSDFGDFARGWSFSQVITLTRVEPVHTPGWDTEASTAITWAEPLERPLYPFARGAPVRGQLPHRGLRIYGNLVAAVHGAPRRGHLGPGTPGPGVVPMSLSPHDAVVVDGKLRALRTPEAPVVHRDGQPLIGLRVGGQRWWAVEHLLRSRAFDRHYVAGADESGHVWLRFGDGVQGAAIELADDGRGTRETLTLDYRIGDPGAGNVAVHTLTRLLPPRDDAARRALDPVGRIALTNVTPGRGGRRATPLESARIEVMDATRHGAQERAVTLADHARLVESMPGVARAAALNLGGPFSTVRVLVDPEGREALDPALAAAIRARLEATRMAGREVVISGPDHVPLELRVRIEPTEGVPRATVRAAVVAALAGDAGPQALFHPDQTTFGEPVYRSRILAHLQRLPEVEAVEVQVLRRRGSTGDPVEDVIALGPTEVARLDGDPERPDHGVLTIVLGDVGRPPTQGEPVRLAIAEPRGEQ